MITTRIAAPTGALSEAKDGVLAFVEDSETRALLLEIAGASEWPIVVQGGGVKAALAAAAVVQPAILLVDLSAAPSAVDAVQQLGEVYPAGTAVIALGAVNDVALYRELAALGIDEYLVKPLAREDLQVAIARVAELKAAPAEAGVEAADFVVVLGVRGGVGATTLAVNAAWLWAHERGQRIVLADLDLHFGIAALALDLETGRGLRGALQDPGRLDGLFLERAMVKESERLFVLGAEESLEEDLLFDPRAVDGLLSALRRGFDGVVLDLPRVLGPVERRVLGAAGRVVLVTELCMPALRDTLRLQSLIAGLAPGAKVTVVAAKAGAAGKMELTRAMFEKGLGRPLDGVIPFDPRVPEALNKGKPLAAVRSNGPALQAIRGLMPVLCGTAGAAPPSFWRRWFGS